MAPSKRCLCATAAIFFAAVSLAGEVKLAYNYCTLSYTMAFWGKDPWSKEIVRIAHRGYNAALVTAGLRKVWLLTLRDMGYGEEATISFLPDSAAVAWWAMGNLEGLGGPLLPEEVEQDGELGRFIAAEMRKNGIEPILQGFTGLVPSSTKGAIPQGKWCKVFTRPALLPVDDPRFDEFAAKWYENLVKVYGIKPKYLAGDLFHEGSAESIAPEEITRTVEHVQFLQQRAFPGVVWVVQSWQASPVQAVQNGLDPRFTLVEALDRDMSNTGAYKGQVFKNEKKGEYLPWIWAEVLNFGGNPGLYGGAKRFKKLGTVPEGLPNASVFCGFALLSEGLGTNDYLYDLFDNRGQSPIPSPENWGQSPFPASEKRGQSPIPDRKNRGQSPFGILLETVWNVDRAQEGAFENVICASGSFDVTSVSAWGPKREPSFDWRKLLGTLPGKTGTVPGFGDKLHVEILIDIIGYKAREVLKESKGNPARQQEFLDLADLLDRVCSCDPEYRLDSHEAKLEGGARAIAGYRRMITTWTPDYDSSVESGLRDYAHRAYSGLIRHYYMPRWSLFFAFSRGELTETEYLDALRKLDRDFPRMEIEPAGQGDLKALSMEVLEKCK